MPRSQCKRGPSGSKVGRGSSAWRETVTQVQVQPALKKHTSDLLLVRGYSQYRGGATEPSLAVVRTITRVCSTCACNGLRLPGSASGLPGGNWHSNGEKQRALCTTVTASTRAPTGSTNGSCLSSTSTLSFAAVAPKNRGRDVSPPSRRLKHDGYGHGSV